LFLAVCSCLTGANERLLWRKPTLILGEAAAIYDPLQSLKIRAILAL